MHENIKKLTVVFPIFINMDGVIKILMGKKAPGTKLEGIRNGYGGKCELLESFEDCAVREVLEETEISLNKEKLIYVGKIIEGDKHVNFYIYFFDAEIYLKDNLKEFIDNKWFILSEIESYISEMIPGNEAMMKLLPKIIENIISKKEFKTFEIDLTLNQETMKVTSQIYN